MSCIITLISFSFFFFFFAFLLQSLVANATPACLRGLVSRLAERELGLVMDLLEEESKRQAQPCTPAEEPTPPPPGDEDDEHGTNGGN